MRSVTYYVANDGTQFDDEEECYQYEVDLIAQEINARGMVKMYDSKQNVLDIADIQSYEECYYVWVGDDLACDELYKIWDAIECGFEQPNFWHKTGLWMYKDEDWLNVQDLIDEYQQLLEEMSSK